MANANAEIVTTGIDRVKAGLAIALVIAGIAGFYALAQQPTVVRLGSILAGVLAGGVVAWFSAPGQRFFSFAKESWSETRRVVWPSRKETTQMTIAVFAFVAIMAVFLWLVDKSIEYALYDLILGWKR